MKTKQAFCRSCDAKVRADAEGVNHILHLALSVVTGGLWIAVWVALCVWPNGWRCSRCGSKI